MTNKLAKLNIKQRILLGFGVVLITSIIFTLFNAYSLRQFHQHFTQYKQENNSTDLTFKIDKNLYELQRKVLVFGQDGQASSTDQLKEIKDTMLADLDQLIKQSDLKEASTLLLLQQMQLSVSSISGQFGRLEKQRDSRDDLINIKLAKHFNQFNDVMTSISSLASAQQGKQLINQFWKAQLSFSKATTEAAQYFNTHQFQKKKEVQGYLGDTEKSLKSALNDIKNVQIKQGSLAAINILKQTREIFNQAVQADRNYLFLTNIVIAGETAELSILSEKLKSQTLAQEAQLFAITEKEISRNGYFAIYITFFSILIALVIALLIGNYISKPLQLIADTFGKLALGEDVEQIPGAERDDEIGRLARAAGVFNAVNLRTVDLLDKSEKMTQALEFRERELEKTNEELSNFTHIASHDLKSPINGIADLIEWVQEDLGADVPEEVSSNLDKISTRVGRMQKLIDELLSYSQAGKKSELVSMLDPTVMMDGIIDLCTVPDNIKVVVNGEIAPFKTTKTPLETTVRNLVSNAIKHHHQDGGHITINMFEEMFYYQFEIVDDGPGIPESEQENIFLLFQTGSKNRKSTGMGLSFCKRMIEAHGGHIEVNSSPGQGALFRIYWLKANKSVLEINKNE